MRQLIINRIKENWGYECNHTLLVMLNGRRTYLGNLQWSDWLVMFNDKELTISDSVWGDAIEHIVNTVSEEKLLELYDIQVAEIIC